MGTVTYFEDLAFAGLTRDQVAAAYDRAAGQWSAVAGISLVRVADRSRANIVAYSDSIDGPYGVLAYSDLPYGATTTSVMGQTFDNAEPWSAEGLDMLVACMCHELGHALGLEHIPNADALMDPYIVPGRVVPQAADVAAIRAVYGPPAAPVATSADRFEGLGRAFAPYLVGTYCDSLVSLATMLEAGRGDVSQASHFEDNLHTCFKAVVSPNLAGLSTAEVAAAFRSLAAGLASTMNR